MVRKAENKKVYFPESIEDIELPEAVLWEEIVDAPRNLAELDQSAQTELETATTAITGLGDLAYEDLVTELELAAGAVTNAKIAVDAIQGAVIAAGAITEVKIGSNAISAGKIQSSAITAAKINAGAVTATKIASNAVTADKIQANAVTAGKINAGAIDGITITGSLIRTSSSGDRVELDDSDDSISIYDTGGDLRARGYDQGWEYYNESGTKVGELYASNSDGFLVAADLTSGGKLYYGVGSAGTHSMHVGTSGSTLRFYLDDDDMFLGNASDYTFDVQIFGVLHANNGIEMDDDLDWGINAGNLYLHDGVIEIDDGFFNLAQMSGSAASSQGGDQNGSMYYRTDDDVIRVKLNGTWKTINTS